MKFVKPPDNPTANVLLYGPPKTGKTTGAACAPGPLLLVNTDLPNATWFARRTHPKVQEVEYEGFASMVEIADQANKGTLPFKTVVIDTVGEQHRRLLEELGSRGDQPEPADLPGGQRPPGALLAGALRGPGQHGVRGPRYAGQGRVHRRGRAPARDRHDQPGPGPQADGDGRRGRLHRRGRRGGRRAALHGPTDQRRRTPGRRPLRRAGRRAGSYTWPSGSA